MLIDAQNLFSKEQKITGTALSANVVAAPENLGGGEPVRLFLSAVEPFAGLTGLEVQLQTSGQENAGFATIQTSGPIAPKDLDGRTLVDLGFVPAGGKKYLRLNYVVSGAATSGKITAGLVLGGQSGKA